MRQFKFNFSFICSLFLLLAFTLAPSNLFAQNDQVDVIYKKDGSVLYGLITKRGMNEEIVLQTDDGNIIVIQGEEILQVTKETRNKKQQTQMVGSSNFFNSLEGGILLGQSDQGQEAHLSIRNVTGYQINPHLSAGIGIGIDSYADSNVFPVFLDLRGYVLRNRMVNPFAYVNMGYGFTSADDIDEFVDTQRGGMMYKVGLGTQIKLNKGLEWMLSFGFGQQSTYAEYTDWQGFVRERNLALRRLLITTGIKF